VKCYTFLGFADELPDGDEILQGDASLLGLISGDFGSFGLS